MHFYNLLSATLLFSIATTSPTSPQYLVSRDSLASSTLRILPLGASITYGTASKDGNGYRKILRDSLSPATVQYAGTQCSGTMTNSNNEGHPGWVVSQMNAVAPRNFASKPNVVLLYVGTNDAKYGNIADTPKNLIDLVSLLTKNLPGSLIVVSKLFPTADPTAAANIRTLNQAISKITWSGNVIVADLSNTLTPADLADGTHPTDAGYAKMAAAYAGVLTNALAAGKIPQDSLPALGSSCNGPPPAPAVKNPSTASPTTSVSSVAVPTITSSAGSSSTTTTTSFSSTDSPTTTTSTNGATATVSPQASAITAGFTNSSSSSSATPSKIGAANTYSPSRALITILSVVGALLV